MAEEGAPPEGRAMKGLGMLAVLALLALAFWPRRRKRGPPQGIPSFTFYGGSHDRIDQGYYRADTPPFGHTTQVHWRTCCWTGMLSGDTEEQPYRVTHDWDYVPLDAPGPDYREDPTA
jgi:MYXO-CTERM domain-containing protein